MRNRRFLTTVDLKWSSPTIQVLEMEVKVQASAASCSQIKWVVFNITAFLVQNFCSFVVKWRQRLYLTGSSGRSCVMYFIVHIFTLKYDRHVLRLISPPKCMRCVGVVLIQTSLTETSTKKPQTSPRSAEEGRLEQQRRSSRSPPLHILMHINISDYIRADSR